MHDHSIFEEDFPVKGMKTYATILAYKHRTDECDGRQCAEHITYDCNTTIVGTVGQKCFEFRSSPMPQSSLHASAIAQCFIVPDLRINESYAKRKEQKGGQDAQNVRSYPGSNRGYQKAFDVIKIWSDNRYTIQPEVVSRSVNDEYIPQLFAKIHAWLYDLRSYLSEPL